MPVNQPLNLADIQGLIVRGYNFHFVRYIIFKINNPDGARKFCSDLLPGSGGALSITDATPWPAGVKPDYCLNIGCTYQGLAQLISKENCTKVNNATSSEIFTIYQAGATDNANTEAIGDTGNSAPENWWTRPEYRPLSPPADGWQLPEKPTADGSELHIQVTLYTRLAADRESFYDTLLNMVPVVNGEAALVTAFYKDSDPIAVGEDLDYIHFGYKDSMSQPRISKLPWNETKNRLLQGVSTIDDRPEVDAFRFVIDASPNADPEPDYNAHPLLQNGSFAAFRFLYQNVEAFETFINSDKDVAPELIAAKMCGRWFDGTPLEVSPHGEDKTLKDFDYTNFNYRTPTSNQKGPRIDDSNGLLCPYSAHIRRTNPRDDGDVTGNAPVNGQPMNAKLHRVVRRATPYGPPYRKGEPAGIQRGLIGLFIGAKLTNQFQFIMQSWMMAGGFRNPDQSPNFSGIDPVFGPEANDPNPADKYLSYCTAVDASGNATYNQISGLTQFIRTDGSLYLFLPGIEGLRSISKGTIPAAALAGELV